MWNVLKQHETGRVEAGLCLGAIDSIPETTFGSLAKQRTSIELACSEKRNKTQVVVVAERENRALDVVAVFGTAPAGVQQADAKMHNLPKPETQVTLVVLAYSGVFLSLVPWRLLLSQGFCGFPTILQAW